MPGVSDKDRVEALKLLGLPRSARPDEIRRRYIDLARELHPDVNPAGGERFRAVSAAYDALRRPRPASERPTGYDQRWWDAFGHLV